jgi:hypothetical protein
MRIHACWELIVKMFINQVVYFGRLPIHGLHRMYNRQRTGQFFNFAKPSLGFPSNDCS